MNTLQEFSDALADVVERAGQQVVRVDARRRLSASGIVWSDDLVITAHHVLERSENIRVGLPDGSHVEAELIGREPGIDLAVLRVKTALEGFQKAENLPRAGNIVAAIGRATANIQASVGSVSTIISNEPAPERERNFDREREHQHGEHRHHKGGRGGGRGFGGGFGGGRGFGGGFGGFGGFGGPINGAIRSDIIMYPGFSGGPLVDASGRLLGMNTSGFGFGSSLSIPLAAITGVVNQLTTHGKIRRGFLGLSVQPMRLTESLAESAGQATGLLIIATEASGPADNAGLYQGDIIIALDGQKTRTMDELVGLLNGERVGSTVPVKIIRGGQTQELSISIGER